MKKNIILVSFILLGACVYGNKLEENKISQMTKMVEKSGLGYKNFGSVAETNIDINRSISEKTREDIKESQIVEVEGIYRLGQLLTCKKELDLSFFYGVQPEMDRLIAIYFLLTKEPFTPENFEPSSQIYIKAQGKVKTNISRSGDLEGVFFLTKLLEYSSDKDLINKCRKQSR